MAVSSRGLLFGIYCVTVCCFLSWKYSVIGVKAFLQLVCRGLLFLAVGVWVTTSLYPKLKSLLFPAGPAQLEYNEADSKLKQDQARKEQQNHHIAKSSAYHEAVLKPRQEALQKKKDEDFYRMTGHTWKLSQGFALGGGEMEVNPEEDNEETPNQTAARKRKQLETPHTVPIHKEPPREKRILILPEEPPENAEGVVKVALRCPSGRTVQRRFFKSCSSSVLSDWMYKSGYSPTIYALFTSYPRRPLLTCSELTIEDIGINKDTALNVGDKDLYTT
ncbi:UBX domain-containing protein 8 [Hoplias malabaricus]|uniref:UBX domain-containing protein 8 n=1 Tax=Hoplias malabaricus TaxID=27720 RepID=UPI0034632EC2